MTPVAVGRRLLLTASATPDIGGGTVYPSEETEREREREREGGGGGGGGRYSQVYSRKSC